MFVFTASTCDVQKSTTQILAKVAPKMYYNLKYMHNKLLKKLVKLTIILIKTNQKQFNFFCIRIRSFVQQADNRKKVEIFIYKTENCIAT